ncbi:hypothetical protein [Kribbella sp. NPDC051620]|uniref:hypothetical protein n=1 Tax=Kribbella sp. NPDC051620 TaxID=3364120 RepID=UPI00378D7984
MNVGQPIPRNSNEYQWVRNAIRSVEKLSGRPSRWNGELYEEPRDGVLGSAKDGGAMTLSVDKVLKPIAMAYTAGRPLTDDELTQVRDAVLTVVHEADHLSHPLGDENAPGATPVYSPENLAVEEGLTETWAHRNVNAVIRDAGMHVANPELLTTESVDSYPAYTAATDELISGTAQVTGLPPSQVRAAMEQSDRTQRFAAVADLVIDERLADVMPPQDRQAVRTQLVQTMRPSFGEVAAAQQSEEMAGVAKSIAGHQGAQRAVTALSTTTAELDNRYHEAAVEQSPEVDHLRKFLGGPPPQAGTYRGAQGDGAVPDNVRALRGRSEKGQSPSL